MFTDLRLALRQLVAAPGFTFIAIVTLALGIGANTSMFSVFNELMVRPLPYPDSGQLDRFYRRTAQNPRGNISPADALDALAALKGYGEIAAYGLADLSLAEPGRPAEMASGLRVSANFFSVFGARPQLGRDFHPTEAVFGNHRVLILSHRFWQSRFGGDPHIVGRVVRVDGEAHEIVGVLPATFSDARHLGGFDLFRPLGLSPRESADRGSTWVRLVGRRDRALSRVQGDTLVEDFGRHLAAEFPAANAGTTWRAISLNQTLTDENGRALIAMLVGLSGLVLLIACSNLANLLLARTMARAREFAVRSALGATRARLLRPLVAESLLLAFGGGVCALLVAMWTTDWLSRLSTDDRGEFMVFTLDWHVLTWAFAASLVTALAFGVAPALFATRLDINRTLKSGSRGTTGDRGHQLFRNLLIIVQFTLAMVLLAGAALFVRGLDDLNNRRIGWESAHLVTATMLLPTATYPGAAEITAFQRRTLERLEALPGVESASLSYTMPFFGLAELRKFLVQGRDVPPPGHEPVAAINGVSPHYFQTVGTRVLQGRTFEESDTAAAPKVFVINQTMARGLFGNASAIGQHLSAVGAGGPESGEIVGVVSDVQSVSPNPSPVTFQLYQPMAQEARPYNEIAVRATGVAAATLVANIRAAMTALDPDLPVRKLQPADATITRSNYQQGVLGTMLSSLAVLGLGLASLGVYGVIARTVAQRTNEFGIRFALGAQVEDITRLVLTSGVKLALIGSAFGLLLALVVARLLAAGFPGIPLQSAAVLVGVTLLLIAVALLACWLPARRAARIDPIIALRAE